MLSQKLNVTTDEKDELLHIFSELFIGKLEKFMSNALKKFTWIFKIPNNITYQNWFRKTIQIYLTTLAFLNIWNTLQVILLG